MAKPFVSDPDFTLYVGDVREVLPSLPADSIDCALTSPPFYALRDYGVDGQLGQEETPEEWAAELVAVFAEVRRVLRPSGTLWIECGDSYDAGTRIDRKVRTTPSKNHGYWTNGVIRNRIRGSETKAKDLIGSPWMLAFALRSDGWYLRQAIIWHKPNVMPESAKDRPTTAHSYIFLLSKEPRYVFDAQAIGEEFSENTHSRGSQVPRDTPKTVDYGQGVKNNSSFAQATWGQPYLEARRRPQAETLDGSEGESPRGPDGRRVTVVKGGENSLQHRDGERWPNDLRHPRSVWTIPTQSFNEAHFATWPEALAEKIIKAGCPLGGVVLDPFMGSGTTALVARRLGRRSVGIELNPEYAAMAARRLGQQSLLAEENVA